MASPASLWRHGDFLRLWAGQSVSLFGDQFTLLALPYIAVTMLGAGPFEMGILAAVGTLPFLLIAIFVGVWVDRHKWLPVLIAGDLGRGLIVLTIALLAFAGLLHLVYLYALGFLTGVLTVFFDVAYQAYLPSLVERSQLVEGNSKLETTNSLAQTGGPFVAGVLIQALSAAWAMVFDASTYFFSVGMMSTIRHGETPPRATDRRSLWAEAREGFAVVLGDRRLRAIAGSTSHFNLFGAAIAALSVLFAVRDLGMGGLALGIVFLGGGIGGLLGALTAARIAARIGVGRAIVVSTVFGAAAMYGYLLATPATGVPILLGVFVATGFTVLLYNINQVSLRQGLVPVRLQGPLNATMRFLVWGPYRSAVSWAACLGACSACAAPSRSPSWACPSRSSGYSSRPFGRSARCASPWPERAPPGPRSRKSGEGRVDRKGERVGPRGPRAIVYPSAFMMRLRVPRRSTNPVFWRSPSSPRKRPGTRKTNAMKTKM